MSYNLYSATHKQWDHTGNVTPNIEVSEGIRPAGDFMPAEWLPVKRYDKYYEEWFTVSSGKVVSFDRQGRVVPAGLKTAFAVESGDVLTYTADDVTEQVVDLTTGVAVAAAGGYTRAEITAALIARGLLDNGENAEDFIGFPVGVAPYNYYKWAGGDGFNPADFTKHNFNLQHRVAVLCHYLIEVPLIPASASQLNLSGLSVGSSAISDWTPATAAWVDATGLAATTRYATEVGASYNPNVVGLNLVNDMVAKSTTATPITFSNTTAFATERSSIAALTSVGDYYLDLEQGMVLCYESGGNAAAATSGTVDYYTYNSSPSSVSTYACALGDLRPGQFVRADANSNFVAVKSFASSVISTTSDGNPSDAELAVMLNQAFTASKEVVGIVTEKVVHPRDYLDRVKTAYTQLGTVDKMPGSATAGLPSALTYSSGSNIMLRILLLR